MKTLEYLVVSHWLDIANADHVHTWVLHEIETNPAHESSLYPLLAYQHPETQKMLERLLQSRNSTFDLHTSEGETILKEMLCEQIELLLHHTISPLLFCTFIQQLESLYLDTSQPVNGQITYPDFLGDLWNACDWCDATWTIENAEYLQEEATRILRTLTISS